MARRTAQRVLPTHMREPIKLRNPDVPPPAWTCWLSLFGASPALARRAWRAFRRMASSDDIGTVVRLQRRQDPAAVQQFCAIMTPLKLFAVLRVLSPETGQERDREILTLEHTILTKTLNARTWR